jgi:hypothetical protein
MQGPAVGVSFNWPVQTDAVGFTFSVVPQYSLCQLLAVQSGAASIQLLDGIQLLLLQEPLAGLITSLIAG